MRTTELVNALLAGGIVLASGVIGLFFLRYWRRSRDRLFLIFAVAFWIFGANRLGLSIVDSENESRTYLYGIRFVAFLLILIAIIDKNRRGNGDGNGDGDK